MIDAKVTIAFANNTSPVDRVKEILKGRGSITKIKDLNIIGKYHIKDLTIRVNARLQFIHFLDKLRDIQEIHILAVKDAKKGKEEKRESLKNREIMVVTEEESFRNHLRVLLQDKGFNVSAFSNNRDAINYITRNGVDLILVDNSTEINSGIKFLKDLNKISKEHKVIIMDKGGGIDLYLEAKKMGAVEYVFRPFKTYELTGIIYKLLDKSKD